MKQTSSCDAITETHPPTTTAATAARPLTAQRRRAKASSTSPFERALSHRRICISFNQKTHSGASNREQDKPRQGETIQAGGSVRRVWVLKANRALPVKSLLGRCPTRSTKFEWVTFSGNVKRDEQSAGESIKIDAAMMDALTRGLHLLWLKSKGNFRKPAWPSPQGLRAVEADVLLWP